MITGSLNPSPSLPEEPDAISVRQVAVQNDQIVWRFGQSVLGFGYFADPRAGVRDLVESTLDEQADLGLVFNKEYFHACG